ncbi:hypothetical protein [Gordonia rubripertincta]|uniref:Uncharacterized protein n=1 Tax=Gordonia rubripertincta TaxID=36822 RepID=A0ABT4N3E7_GORRU|nr:hypothetical protein [Gordonia rubripertincta]MCZ4553815.1 hypothetical protein [Gordonia rubripertincta]
MSTGTDANGWGVPFNDEAGQAGKHSTANVNDQDGSLELKVTVGNKRSVLYHSADSLPVGQWTGTPSFDQNGTQANWQVRVTKAATVGAPPAENGFATFVWSGGGDQWWATRALPDLPRGQTTTLADLKSKAGAATVVTDYGISVEGEAGTTANVDNVKFNGCTTNFKASGPSGEDTGSTGSLGGFGLASLIPGLPS